MTPKQKILTIRLSEKIEKHQKLSQDIGITVSYKSHPQENNNTLFQETKRI